MSFIAIIGAGPLGGAIAHKLAGRDRVGEVRLIDGDERIAQGKALDIPQSAPVEGFSTRVTAAGAIAAAAGAAAIVVADAANGQGEHSGESGLALLRQLAAIESAAPIVCAGATQRELIARAVDRASPAGVARDRIRAAGARVGAAGARGARHRRVRRRSLAACRRRAAAGGGGRLGGSDRVCGSRSRRSCRRTRSPR